MSKKDFSVYIGQIFGDMKVISVEMEWSEIGQENRSYFVVECQKCKHRRRVRCSHLLFKRAGWICEDACLVDNPHRWDYLVGTIQDDMKVLKVEKHDGRLWSVFCECIVCGKQKWIQVNDFKKHVGCYHKYCVKGMKYPRRLIKIFDLMLHRCNKKENKSFCNYGGRCIKVIWKDIHAFIKDMLDPYLEASEIYDEKNVSIERIDVDGNYCKENCKWIPIWEQAWNKQSTTFYQVIDPNGKVTYITNVNLFCVNHNLQRSGIVRVSDYGQSDYFGWKFKRVSEQTYKAFWDSYVFVEKQTVLNILDGFYEKYKSRPDITQGRWVKITLSDLEKYFKDRKFAREEIDMLVSPNPNRFGLKIYYHSKLDTFFLTK